jgi:histone arginine demethylase JMJD6
MEISDICRKKTWERRVDKAKKKDRPKLKNWSRGGFCFTRKLELQNYFSQTFRNNNLLVSDNKQLFTYNFPPIPRFSCSNITVEGFINKYEKNYIPCIIEGIPAAEGWKAVEKWSFKYFKIFGKRYFKVGEDDDGYKVKLRMKYFLTYMKKNQDDSPLYIFDGNFDTDPVSKQLLQEYKVPSYFPDDLFSLVGEKRRPPYRWFLVGPARSGTCIHIDPLGTSAWNTLLQGIKRWVLIPPGILFLSFHLLKRNFYG